MIYSQNFIGSTISFLLPYVTNAAWYFAQPMITSQIKNYIKKEVISKLVNRYFNKPIMETNNGRNINIYLGNRCPKLGTNI